MHRVLSLVSLGIGISIFSLPLIQAEECNEKKKAEECNNTKSCVWFFQQDMCVKKCMVFDQKDCLAQHECTWSTEWNRCVLKREKPASIPLPKSKA